MYFSRHLARAALVTIIWKCRYGSAACYSAEWEIHLRRCAVLLEACMHLINYMVMEPLWYRVSYCMDDGRLEFDTVKVGTIYRSFLE